MISLQPCHLTEPSECQAPVDLAGREYGRIDVLFNNAAMAYFNWLEEITNEEWNRDLREEIDLVFSHPRGVAASGEEAVEICRGERNHLRLIMLWVSMALP
jgi:NADP-dependent 3-hydroxy acid dehydrogenase YdfG